MSLKFVEGLWLHPVSLVKKINLVLSNSGYPRSVNSIQTSIVTVNFPCPIYIVIKIHVICVRKIENQSFKKFCDI